MTMRNVGFRLGMDGKAEVKNDFAEVKKAGDDAMESVAVAAEQAGERAARATETYTKRQIDSYQRQANAAKLAAAGVSANASVDQVLAGRGNAGQFATVNLDRSTGAAKASAAVFAAAFEEEERGAREAVEAQRLLQKAEDDRAATVAKLRAMLDPLTVAQHRYDEELATYNDLLKRTDLNEEEHGRLVAMSTQRLNEAKRSLDGHTSSAGFNRMQMVVGGAAIRNFFDSVSAGTPVMRAAVMQAGDFESVLSMDEGGVAGGLRKVGALLTPTRLLLGGVGLAAAIGAKAWYDYSAATEKLSAAARGTGMALGLSGMQLEASAEAAAAAGHMTVDSARQIETGYLQVAKSGDVLVGLTAVTNDFAKATGTDLAGAQKVLAGAFQDPIAGAQALAGEYGFLTQAQIEHIAKLVEEGDYTRAQAELLKDLQGAIGGAAAKTEGLAYVWDNVKSATDRAWVSLGRYLDMIGQVGLNGQGLGFLLPGADEQKRKIDAAGNQALQRAMDVAGAFSGDSRDQYQKQLGTLRAGLKALPSNASAEDRRQLTGAIDAYSNAIATFIPRQEKANQLAAIDAKLAAAKTPAERSALAAQRQRLDLAGTVISRQDAETRATEAGNRARNQAERSGAGRAAAAAREAASMEASARAALDVADAYLKSSAAGIEAEARRKALTDATKKGTDVDAQVRRQLALNVAEGVANGAKSVASMRDETTARLGVLAQVRDGTLAVTDMSAALADEAALRPLLALRTIAQGDALTRLNTLIDQYREAMTGARAAETSVAFEKAMQGSVDRAEEFKSAIADIDLSPLDKALNAAGRAANLEADGLGLKAGSAERTRLVRQREREAEASYQASRSKYVTDSLVGQRDALALTQRELELVGANDNVRQAELDKLKVALDIRRQFPDMAAADVDRIVAGVVAQGEMNAKLKVAAAAMGELRSFGAGLVDTVLDPSNWDDWGSAGKAITRELQAEFMKLALLNPLKNLINGNSDLPTLSSALGKLGALFGGGKSAAVGKTTVGLSGLLSGNAVGTEYWSGGMTYVNENGKEIMDLPSGTRIYPAAESRRMMAANDVGGGGRMAVDINLNTDLFTATVTSISGSQLQAAAPGIAVGAARLSGAQEARRRRRRLPGT